MCIITRLYTSLSKGGYVSCAVENFNYRSLVHGRKTDCSLVLKYPDTQVHISISEPGFETELAEQGVHSWSLCLAYEQAAQAVWIVQ